MLKEEGVRVLKRKHEERKEDEYITKEERKG